MLNATKMVIVKIEFSNNGSLYDMVFGQFVSIYDSNYENIVEFFSSSQSALIFFIFV